MTRTMQLLTITAWCVAMLTSQAARSAPTAGRIDIRPGPDGDGELYNVRTGERFEPYGFNYIVLGNRYPSAKAPSGYHNLFDTEGDNGWDANREIVKRDFADIAAHGYNTVRVFLNVFVTGRGGPDAEVNAAEPGIDTAYFDNYVECLSIARANGLYVTFVLGRFPSPYLPVSPEGPIQEARSAQQALRTMENKMLPYIDVSLIRAQHRYIRDVLRYVLKSGLREVIFSIEPQQEVGFRARYGEDGKLMFVYPWNEKLFGPWPANPEETAIEPSIYDLSPGSDDPWRFYRDVSYYYPEQLTQAVREVEGAEDLLVTFSTGELLNPARNTVGFDDSSWFHWLYAPALGRLAEEDGHMYVDTHFYPHGFEPPPTENPQGVHDLLDRKLFSFGLLDGYEGPEKKSKSWRREQIRVPMLIGELGARTPMHPKNPPAGEPGLATPEMGVAALRETVRHARSRGYDGFLFWLYSTERTKPGDNAPSSFYNPRQYPEFHRELAPKPRTDP